MIIHGNTDLGKNVLRWPLNDPERDEVPLPAEVVFLLQT